MVRKNYTIQKCVAVMCMAVFLLLPTISFAQEGMSFTVTPPLFQFTLAPGESWASSVKIVNGNDFDMTVYATPMNFESTGEGGTGKHVPLSIEDTASSSHSLAAWIDITEEPIFVPRGQSVRIPFFVVAPDGAEPGGHYATILIGTRPMEGEGGSQVKVSSLISTLLFARVSGDIVEEGRIREFSTEKVLYETPEANFKLRFENIGNVHLLPRGNIIIYNMWGKERGRIDVNKEGTFGNVFPGKTRNFSFTWTGESNFYDIGRYKAISTLAYGAGERQSDFQALYFWVVPIKPLIWIVSIFALLVTFITLTLRRYVKHALKMQTEILLGSEQPQQTRQPAPQAAKQAQNVAPMQKVQQATPMQILRGPVVQGAVDLRRASAGEVQTEMGETMSMKEFMKKYRTFFIFAGAFAMCVIIIVFFLRQVMVDEREFDIQIQEIPAETPATLEE